MSPESAIHWMERCLCLAANADSATSPNPRVGCVILSPEGTLLGEGWHKHVGGPHAETEAMNQVRSQHGSDALHGATLVVNLEPCNHQGRTPPCTRNILNAGIVRVIIGMRDPNPTAAGGIDQLRSANVSVMTEVLKTRCFRFNEAFAHRHLRQAPFVTLKIAQTLDGCIATATGESQWITGKAARKLVHIWRRENDAVLIGSGTAYTDNPGLTVRHVSGTQPWRIVLDGQGRLPRTLKIFTDEWVPRTIAVVAQNARPGYAGQFQNRGGRLITVQTEDGHVALPKLIRLLGSDLNIQSLFVEAGPGLASALLKQDLVDRFRLFIAPKLIGKGRQSIGDLGIHTLGQSKVFRECSWESVEDDQLFTGYKYMVPA